MKIQLLGSPAISFSNRLNPTFKTAKAEGLFYYLAATQRTYARAPLATLFWGDMAETKARVNLSKALSELREQIGEYVTIATQTVTFNTALPYQLDVETFLAAPPQHNPGDVLAVLQEHADLYRGDFLDGFYVRNAPDFEQWLQAEREQLRTVAAQRFATLAKHYQQNGNLRNAISTVRRLLALEPWREEAHYQLMELLVRNGEPHAALHQYELCRVALADELAVEPGSAITNLYTEIRARGKAAGSREHPTTAPIVLGRKPSALTKEQATLPHNLPHPPTTFVGREAEINTLVARMQDPACRLLTLVGPGGIGKTRLALEVARHFIEPDIEPGAAVCFPEGIFFVNLMPVDTEAGMVATIAEALGFTFYNNTPPQQQLLNYLKARKLLLILDNFEHLIQESALVVDLLAAAPMVKVVVTAREVLPLQAAYFHTVQGLSYSSAQQATLEDAPSKDAVRLFAQSAQRHQAAFALSQHLESVVAICRLVGGMPLALELAAAWLKSLSCAQIAQGLEKGVALLHANLVDLPERHRNMCLVFEQSWQRLSAPEAAVMQRLALFRGGFTLAAAEQVAQATIHTLAALVEKALIRLDDAGRYQVHELLRQFAHEKLAAQQEQADSTAAAHAQFFLTLAGQLKTSLEDKRQPTALATMQADIDNLRVAWLWALQQPDLPDIDQALESLYAFFLFTCRYSEGKELFATSVALLEGTSSTDTLVTRLKTKAAVFAYHLGEYEEPSRHFRALLATTPTTDPQRDIAIAHMILGQIAGWQGHNAEAEAYLQKSVALYEALDDRSSMATVLHGMAEMYTHAAAYQQAVDSAQACFDIGVQLGRDDLIGSAHYTTGHAQKSLGRPKLALQHYQQGCIYTEKAGDRLGYALSVGGVGLELCQLGQKQWAQGFALVQQSLAICRELGHLVHIVTRLFTLAQACIDGKRYAEAIPFAEECVQIATAANLGRGVSFGLYTLGETYYAMGDFGLSRLRLQQAARKAIECNYHGLLHIVVAYGLLLEKEATQFATAAAAQNRLDAVALATAALRRPAWHVYHQKAQQLLERQQAFLATDQFAAAQTLAEQQTLETLVTQILGLDHDKVTG